MRVWEIALLFSLEVNLLIRRSRAILDDNVKSERPIGGNKEMIIILYPPTREDKYHIYK